VPCVPSWTTTLRTRCGDPAALPGRSCRSARLLCYSPTVRCMQVLLEETATELHALEATMATLKQELATVTHDNVLIDTSISARRSQIKTLEEIALALVPRIRGLKDRASGLHRGLQRLLGNSILAAALVVYAGMLPWADKQVAVSKWSDCLKAHDLLHTPNYSLCEAMDFLDQQHIALPRSVIVAESLRHAMFTVLLVSALLPTSQHRFPLSSHVATCGLCFLSDITHAAGQQTCAAGGSRGRRTQLAEGTPCPEQTVPLA
jgi:hypothetical protein